MSQIEANIKEICRREGLSLTDLANRIGTSPSNLVNRIKGNPTFFTLMDIADALQVSVSELLTKNPEKALGIVTIDGQTYQLSKPAANIVQVPTFDRYDLLRMEVGKFIGESIKTAKTASKMGYLGTLEIFSLVYDAGAEHFTLSLCYTNGKIATITYDKFEFCDWSKSKSEDDAPWDLKQITEEIINDLEGYVPSHLPSAVKPRKANRKADDGFEFDEEDAVRERRKTLDEAFKQEE